MPWGDWPISEDPLPGIEGGAAFQLASTGSAEFLPYLVVMLGSPSPSTRDLALISFCQLLKGQKFWTAEMLDHCPNRAPLNDPVEQKDIRFWTEWWQAHRVEIAKTVALPNVSAPARYNIAVNTGGQPVEVPMEIRFLSLLHMARSGDPIASQLAPSDRASYDQVCAAVNAKLAVIQKRSEEMLNAARIRGTLPPVIADDRLPAVKAALDDLHDRLSPAGWRVFEKFLSHTAIGMGQMAAPAK